jgi:hypothetical protein
VVETVPSPITGVEGNREFLLYARRPASTEPIDDGKPALV